MRRKNLVFSSKTGTGTSSEVNGFQLYKGAIPRLPVMAKFSMTVGETPTITLKLQGLRTADESWIDLATTTKTEEGTYYLHADVPKRCRRYRLNITSNTNVTVTTAYIGVGTVEN